MKHFTPVLLVAGILTLATPVSAQVARQLQSHNAVAAQAAKAAQKAFVFDGKKASEPQKELSLNPSDYGQLVTIVKEDFSKLTTGTEEKPDKKTTINYDNDDNYWINLSGDYTETFGWGCHGGYPAGGCLWVTGGQVNTPMLDLSGNDGIFFVKFRARTVGEDIYSQATVVEAAETYDMSPSWDVLGSYTVPKIDNEWREYEYMFYGGGKTTLVNICPQDCGILIDDIEVYQVDQYVNTPVAHNHRYYTGKTFNLSWDAVDGADKYLLDVYTVQGDGATPNDYIQHNTEVKGTEYIVDNAFSGDTYYYTVRAVKGDKESMASSPVQILDVETPTLAPVENVSDGKYTAKWNEIETAERYNYLAAAKKVVKEDGEYDVAHLYMRGAQYPEGLDADVTYWKDAPDDRSRTSDRGYPMIDGGAAWRTTHYAIYKDALVLDGFWTTNGSDAGIISPEYDLSKDGGNFRVNLRLAAEAFNYQSESGADVVDYPHCAVAVFNYDKAKDDYVQSELKYLDKLTEDWADYKVKLTTGTEHTIVGVYATYAPCNVYVQSLYLKQNAKAGDYYYEPFYYGNFLEGTSVDVEVPHRYNGEDIYHKVQSVKVKRAAQSEYESTDYLESKMSAYQLASADVVAGVDAPNVALSSATVRLEGENLVVNNPEGETVSLYTVGGAAVASDASGDAVVKFAAPASGAYIVKVGTQTVKVTL